VYVVGGEGRCCISPACICTYTYVHIHMHMDMYNRRCQDTCPHNCQTRKIEAKLQAHIHIQLTLHIAKTPFPPLQLLLNLLPPSPYAPFSSHSHSHHTLHNHPHPMPKYSAAGTVAFAIHSCRSSLVEAIS